jgi:hypothetical protein
MKTLESQRALHLKAVEAAGNVEVLDVTRALESKLSSLSTSACKEAWRQQYIRTGSFSNGTPGACVTNYVDCSDASHARLKEYFEQRNPNTTVLCFKAGEDDRVGNCQARIKPESFF